MEAVEFILHPDMPETLRMLRVVPGPHVLHLLHSRYMQGLIMLMLGLIDSPSPFPLNELVIPLPLGLPEVCCPNLVLAQLWCGFKC